MTQPQALPTDPAAHTLAEVRARFEAGCADRGLAIAREAYARIDTTAARIAFMKTLFVLTRDARFEPGVAFSLRALRKHDTLSFGEARRLFLAFERLGRSALVDRYLAMLQRALPRTGLPLRKALNLLWATGRSEAMLDHIRVHAPQRLADRETVAVYAALFVKFDDLAHATPLFVHLVELDPADGEARLGLARGLSARDDLVGAAQHCLAAAALDHRSDEVARVAEDLCDALRRALTRVPSDTAEPFQLALRDLEALDPRHTPDLIAEQTPNAPREDAITLRQYDLDTIEEAVALLSPLHPATRAYHLVSQAAARLVQTAELGTESAPVERLLHVAPHLAATLAQRFMAAAETVSGIALFRALAEDHAAPVWLQALRLATSAGSPEDIAVFAEKLAATPDASVVDLRDAALALSPSQSDVLDRFWMCAVAANRSDRVVPIGLRSLYALGGSAAFYPIALAIAAGDLRPTVETTVHIEAMRVLLARSWRWSDAAGAIDGTAQTLDPALPEDVALWTRAIFTCALFDYPRARALLDEGFDRWPDSETIDFARERAILAARFGKYGIVATDLADVDRATPSDGHHGALRTAIAVVAAAAPPAPDALYPQYLIDTIFDRPSRPLYEPIPRSLVTIAAALAAGGSERQAVTMIEALSHDPRVASQSLLIRSVTPERRGFFLPEVEASGIAFHVFEHDTADLSHVLTLLGEPPGSPLSIALPLLPDVLRTTICHLIPLLIERRPAVVHIRQDFYAAALACVLAGVPRFFIHRGSLAPSHWHLTVPQTIATVAPMQHAYRRLLSAPGFGLINNSNAGIQSDIEWTGCDDPERFSLVHNIVDFARLGPSRDTEDSVRRSIGAAPGDLVVGAAFRFHRVKRPLLWLAAARHILNRHPEAHFLMLGDGDMKSAIMDFAEAEGFADRLHLPGSISDLGPWYQAMDIALLTSEREGLPNMLIEAQHFGVVPVSTNVGGTAETMAAGVTGVLVPTDATPEAIGDAVVAAFDDRAWFERARAAARDFVHARFGTKTAIDQIVGLYGFPR